MMRLDALKDPHVVIQEADTQAFLRRLAMFKDVSRQSIRMIEKRIHPLFLKKGARIMSENDAARGVFFVQSGAVKLSKQDQYGNEVIVCIKEKGEVFGEVGLLTKMPGCCPATATMLREGKVLFLDKMELERDLSEYPGLSVQIIRSMSNQLRERISQFVMAQA